MDMSFSFFLRQLVTNPALLITVLLTLGVICVNGITDAPNAIATCVSTRSLDVNLAIAMAAVCNCAGVVVMTMVNSTVAMTITNMVNFGEDTSIALVALCAALFSIVVWSSFAVSIGCPTSESHALIAGLTGAAVAIRGGFSAINSAEWIKVVYGLIFSVVLGFLSGYLSCKLVAWTCRDMDRRKTTGFFRYAQIGGAAAMAFMHGAQDGQKFMGVMLLGICMERVQQYPGSTVPSVDAFAGIGSHGPGNVHRRKENHQIRGYGYGKAGEIPGLFRGYGGSCLSSRIFHFRYSCQYHTY